MVLLVIGAQSAQADLFISPLRVIFDDATNAAQVVLVNQSPETRTYRITWVEKIALPDGTYENFEPPPEFVGASSLVRFSPRQVTLGPREVQQVRLSLNREADLPTGEYRSHLTFTEVGQPERRGADAPAEGVGIELVLSLSFAIPVMVRAGDEETVVAVTGARFMYDRGERLNVELDIARDGPFSVYGDMSVFWQPNENALEQKIGALNNVAIYPEVLVRQARIVLTEQNLTSGVIRIIFIGRGEYAGRTWFETSMRIAN